LQCGSFSKSLAPGYRIGWAVPGKHKNKVIALKRMNNVSTNTLLQEALAVFLQKGRYELHLRNLRKALHTQCLRYSQAIAEYFPSDIKVTRPRGGFSLWIEMDESIDAYKLHKQALKHNIGIAPGHIFSTQGQFHNYFRISYGLPWEEKIDKGIKVLGELIKKY
jgi:DNA-binding transcriptional MocR family regulator